MLAFFFFYIDAFRGLSWKVWKLAGVFLINRSGMMVLPFLALYVTQDLGWSKTEAMIINACFGFGSLAGAYLGGVFADKIGIYKTMLFALLGSGLLFMCMGFVQQFYMLCFLMFLTTTVGDLFRPASFTALSLMTTKENVTRGISLIRIAINLGISIGPFMGGILAATVGYFWLFMVDGLTCLFAAVLLILLLKPPKRKVEEEEPKAERTKSPYKDKIFMVYLFFNLLNLIVFFQILQVVPVYFKEEFGMTEIEIGYFFMFNGLMIVFLEMPIIYWLEKRKAVFIPLLLGMVLIGFSFLSFYLAFVSALLAVIVYNVLTTVGEIINFPFINTVALERCGKENTGAYMGAVAMLFSLALIIAPVGLPLSEKIGYTSFWPICGIVCFIAALGIYVIKDNMNQEELTTEDLLVDGD